MLDGKEIIVTTKSFSNNKVKVILELIGNPTIPDTDGDGLNDKQEYDEAMKTKAVSGDSRNNNAAKNRIQIWDVSDRDLAIFAQLAYYDLENSTPISQIPTKYPTYYTEMNERFDGNAKVSELNGWRVFGLYNDSTANYVSENYDAVVFKNDKDGQLVLASRGTENINDWKDNLIFFLKNAHPQQTSAKNLASALLTHDVIKTVHFTGHSLGGNLTYHSAAEGLKNHTKKVGKINSYNGLGLYNDKIEITGVDGNGQIQFIEVEGDYSKLYPILKNYKSKIKAYTTSKDPLNSLNVGIHHPVKVTEFESIHTGILNIDAHFMMDFYYYLKWR